MLSHLHRFHGHGSLRYLYRHGTLVRSTSFQLRHLNNPHRIHSRFAIVVSKKVYKSAVKRNTLRRRIYEVIRLELPHIKPSQDIVITVLNKDILTMPLQELREQIKGILAKEHLIS